MSPRDAIRKLRDAYRSRRLERQRIDGERAWLREQQESRANRRDFRP